MEENDLQPEDIETITHRPHPVCQFEYETRNQLITEDDYAFHGGYLLACAAHRINPARWHDPEVKEDPGIMKFMQRVEFKIVIDEKKYKSLALEHPDAIPMGVEVVARGQVFKEENVHVKGTWQPEEFRNTDEELIEKFSHNSSRVLSPDKIDRVSHTILCELDTLEDITEVMEILSP
jgi:2-methylcitrate dehydratase PrpD